MSGNSISSKRISPDLDNASIMMSHPLISRLTKTNIFSYYIVYSLLIAYFIIQSAQHYTWTHVLSGLVAGIVIWSLIEYLMHRFVFHWKSRTALEKIIVFILHDVHHSYPKDVSRSITPLVLSLPLALLFYFLFIWIFGNFTLSVYAGFLSGYLMYTIIHDSTHHFPMKFSLTNNLKRNHMRHHYFDNTKNFGVSSPIWDYVFKTYTKG